MTGTEAPPRSEVDRASVDLPILVADGLLAAAALMLGPGRDLGRARVDLGPPCLRLRERPAGGGREGGAPGPLFGSGVVTYMRRIGHVPEVERAMTIVKTEMQARNNAAIDRRAGPSSS